MEFKERFRYLASRPSEVNVWSSVSDGCATLWFLSEVTSQYSIRVPLKLGAEFYAVVDQGWLEAVVSRGAFDVRRTLLQRVRVLYQGELLVGVFAARLILAPLLVFFLR